MNLIKKNSHQSIEIIAKLVTFYVNKNINVPDVYILVISLLVLGVS